MGRFEAGKWHRDAPHSCAWKLLGSFLMMTSGTVMLVAKNVANAVPMEVERYVREMYERSTMTSLSLLAESYGDVFRLDIGSEHVFDIASLTKIFVGTTFLHEVGLGTFSLDEPICEALGATDVFGDATYRELLTHSSGLMPRHPDDIPNLPNIAKDYSDVVWLPERRGTFAYSNLGFVLLGKTLEVRTGRTLDDMLAELDNEIGARAKYLPLKHGIGLSAIAPTELMADGSHVHGVVHDENARTLGGVAGHAGIFATSDDLIALLRAWRGWFRADGYMQRRYATMATSVQLESSERRGFSWQLRSDAKMAASRIRSLFNLSGVLYIRRSFALFLFPSANMNVLSIFLRRMKKR